MYEALKPDWTLGEHAWKAEASRSARLELQSASKIWAGQHSENSMVKTEKQDPKSISYRMAVKLTDLME